jgi:formate--tetrahydrofolate ligase
MQTNIEIARAAKMRPILEIAQKLDIPPGDVHQYGPWKAKVSLDHVRKNGDNPKGKLILVTAMTPTTAGEGKSTTTVGLGDGLNRIGKRAMICLREPSLGPCFGM